MTKDFIPYTQAIQLKELGFDEKCLAYWFNETPPNPEGQCLVYYQKPYDNQKITNGIIIEYSWAPLYQQAFRWFREKYDLRGFIGFRPNTKQFDYHIYDMSLSGKEYVKQRTMEEFNKDPLVGTYEEVELACLIKLIEIVKNK